MVCTKLVSVCCPRFEVGSGKMAEESVEGAGPETILVRVASAKSLKEEEDGDKVKKTAEEEENMRWLRNWHYAELAIIFVESILTIVAQLLYAIGLNKIISKVLDIDFTKLLNDFWQTVLLVDWKFEEFVYLFIATTSIHACLNAVRTSTTYYFCKAVVRVIRSRVAEAALQGNKEIQFDNLLELSSTVERIERYMYDILYVEKYQFFIMALGFLLIFIVAPDIGGILLLLVLVFVASTFFFQTLWLGPKRQEISESEGILNDIMVDLVRMKNVIILSDTTKEEVDKLKLLDEKSDPAVRRITKFVFSSNLVNEFVTFIIVPVMLTYTFYAAEDANSLFGLLTALLIVMVINTCMQNLIRFQNAKEDSLISINKLSQSIDTTDIEFVLKGRKNITTVGDSKEQGRELASETTNTSEVEPLVEFKHVDIGYPTEDGKELTILKDLSFKLEAGKSVAIVGETGSGKSTLMKTILGFLTPKSGEVLVEGHRLEPGTEAVLNWHRRVSVVHQDSPMFKRSIRDNLTYGRGYVSSSRLQEAIDKACLTEWLGTLESGIETVLELREVQLSGGQRQRVQLCRCFLGSQNIIFMDEPTASLDPATRELVTNNLEEFFRDKTAVVITHDENLLRIFDQVYKLSREKGLVLVN